MHDQQGFRLRETLMETWQRLLEREEAVKIGGITQQLEARTPGLNANRNRYRNRFSAAKINISVAARGTGIKERDAAQRAENAFFRFYFDFVRKRTAAVFAPDDRAEDFAVWAGVGVRNLEWADDVKEKLGTKKLDNLAALKSMLGDGFQGNPFALHAPHPMQVFYEPDFSVVCEVGEKKIASLLTAFDQDDFERFVFGDETSDTVPLDEALWDEMWKFYHLETREFIYDVTKNEGNNSQEPFLLDRRLNPAGRPRYTFQAGHLTSSNEPGKMFQPDIKDLYPLAQLKNMADTLLMTGMLNTGRPMFQEVADGAKSDDFLGLSIRPGEVRKVISIDLSQNEMPEARPGHHWEAIQVPTPDQLVKAKAAIDEDFLRYGFPQELGPNSPLDATSGFDRAKQQEVAADFLEPPLKNKAAAWHETFMLIADMLQETGMSVSFPTIDRAGGGSQKVQQSVTVKPSDFKEIDLEVTFSAVPATAQFAQDESDDRKLQLGLMSRQTWMAARYDDPVAEQEKIDQDKVGDFARQQAVKIAQQIIEQMGPQLAQQIAQEEGIPEVVPQPGGPAPDEAIRKARPPEGAIGGGLGGPPVPPPQSQNGVPPGTAETIGTAGA